MYSDCQYDDCENCQHYNNCELLDKDSGQSGFCEEEEEE